MRTLLNATAHDLCGAVAERADPTLDLARRTLGRLAPRFFKPLEAIVPNLTWTTTALATDRDLQLHEPDQAWLLASGGRPLAFLDRDFAQLTRMLTLATCNWSFDATNFDGLRWLQGVGKRIVGEYYANHRLILLYREGCGNVFPVTAEDRPRMIFWRALVPPAWWTDPARTAPPHGEEYDARTLTLRRIWGGMLAYFDQVRSGGPPAHDRWLDLALRCMWRNARRDGIEVAVALDQRWQGRWSSPSWRSDRGLHLLRIPSAHQVAQNDQWAAIETTLVDPPIRLRIARRLCDPLGERPTWTNIGTVWHGIGLAWLLGGILVLATLTLHRGRSSLLPPLTLHRQLLLAFLVVLVPGAAVSTMQLERSFGERAWRLHADCERSLHQRLDAVENARTLYMGQALATIQTLARRPEYVNTWYATTGPHDRGATPPARLGRLGRQLVDHGVILKDLVMADSDGFRCQAISGASDTARGANDQVRTFASLHARTLRELAPDYGPTHNRRGGENLGEGLKDEELGNFLGSVLLPEHLAEQFMAPRSLSTPGGQLNDKLVYNQMLKGGAHPPLLLSCVLDIEGIMLGYFRDVMTSNDLTSGYRVGVTFANHPAWSMAPPWFKGHWATTAGKWVIDVPTLYAFNPPEIEQPLGWTQVSGEPMTTVAGTGSARRMILTRSPVTPALSGRLLHATRNIGRAQARLAAYRERAHLLLGLLALVSLVLAMQLAGALLRPVLELAAAAHRVMAGDFTGRLPGQGTDEFARLGAAFNVMVRGVAEGRMLGRFVSAAVHDAVRDAEREAAARRGEHRTITVMFAGLGGFGERLQKWPPAPLITALNRVLEAWSRHIRAHGGEIDKFIGEKILAVFPPERFADATAAAAAAVAAGRALRAEMDRHRKYLDLPAGVGIVSGPVLAGILGTDQVRREHTVIGDTVNLAARLCELATHQDGGDLLLDGGTVRLLHGDANTTADGQALIGHFARLPVTSVKGKRREIEVFRWCD